MRAVLGAFAAELRDRQLPLDAVVAGPLARELAGTVAAAATASRRVQDRFVAAEPDRRVETACRRLWNSAAIDVADVAADIGLSARQLRRLLHADVGVGPKTFQRVGRLHRFLTIAERRGAPWPLAESALAAGYSDQAHLGRDVRELAGTTPLHLLREREVGWRTATEVVADSAMPPPPAE
ncbi:hypothetical protein DEF23_26660 [Marinitenerispora sediminis]|uniref:HTH araC/xylS-type domain-containing protein n=1 Tax=Marinitenerispora sediminis TaxID=1931232 RepID=A0A368T7E2_9ACTN|nr:hypothetical protein DEF23_26660 [Marinitenerispora sediminis]RCV54206.1 hypothetical protein DEF28_08630 [Marinitenerispora sediminis]RCV59505.1 hypothetical protein DEF24_09395 [Marinitenerispora sediminis]